MCINNKVIPEERNIFAARMSDQDGGKIFSAIIAGMAAIRRTGRTRHFRARVSRPARPRERMCTVVILIRPGHPWPVMLAANRDERIDRQWDPPSAWWPDRPGVIAGRDRTAGGTWMGINSHGLVACVLNRSGTLGPAAGKHSRGELPLMALEHRTAADAAAALAKLDAGLWRGFNLVLADRHGVVFVRGAGHGHPQPVALAPGVSMVTAHDPNDPGSPRVARHLARFQAAERPLPEAWEGWRTILSDLSGPAGAQMNVTPRGGFGTVCSSMVALPEVGAPLWLFAPGPPHDTAFRPLALPG